MFNLTDSLSLSRVRNLTLVMAMVSLWSVVASTASAQQVRTKFKDKIHVVQPKPVLQKGRVEFAPRFGASVNDDIYRSVKLGAQLNVHLAEFIYVGAMFDWFDFGDTLGGPTSSYEDVANQTGASADTAVVKWAGGAEVGVVPFVGKFSFFNSAIVYYDVAISLGGAYVNAESLSLPGAEGTLGGTVALSSRFFVNRWLALNFEARDLIFQQDLAGSSGSYANVVTLSGGLSFFLPTSFEYSDQVVDSLSE